MQTVKITWKQYVAIGIVCTVIFAYTVYHIASLFREDLMTFAAGITTETETIGACGYVFRDEQVLYSSNGGVADYLCADGMKVSLGQPLTEVHESGSTSERRSMETIDRQIGILQDCAKVSGSSTDIADLQRSVNDTYYILVNMLASGNTGELSLQVQNMLSGMDRLNLLTEGENSPVTQTLDDLLAARQTLLDNAGGGIAESAPEGGYFYRTSDGYETSFTCEAAENMSGDGFYRLISSEKASVAPEGQAAYGKLAKNSEWYFALALTPAEAAYFEEGDRCTVEFTENNGQKLPMTLVRTAEAESFGTVVLIFFCDRLPENFTFHRSQIVRIEVDSVSGLYVPKKAVERVDGVRGVYILRGNVVHFRAIEIEYESKDYYLVDPYAENEEDYAYLRENDLVILNGTNLFEGRIFD